MAVRIVLSLFIIGLLAFDSPLSAQFQKRNKTGIRKAPRGNKDPFSSSRKTHKVHLDAGLSFSPKRYKAKSKRKKYSLKGSQARNRYHSHQKRKSKGIAYGHNVAADYFSKKSKKKFRGYGTRGESFYKRKRKMSRFKPHGGRESRRMERTNKSFKK